VMSTTAPVRPERPVMYLVIPAQCTTEQVRRPLLLCVDSLLNRYLLVSGSVRVRARAMVSARITVRDRDRI